MSGFDLLDQLVELATVKRHRPSRHLVLDLLDQKSLTSGMAGQAAMKSMRKVSWRT